MTRKMGKSIALAGGLAVALAALAACGDSVPTSAPADAALDAPAADANAPAEDALAPDGPSADAARAPDARPAVDAAPSPDAKPSPDARPIIAAVDAPEGLIVSTGYSGHGFGIGPGAGRATAALVLGESPGFDLSPFRLSRFFDGTPITPGPL